MYKKILAPLDGSKLSECSLDHVKTIASACNVPEIELVMVVERVQMVPGMPTTRKVAEEIAKQEQAAEQQNQKRADDYLAQIAQQLKKDGLPVKTVTLKPGEIQGVAEIILDYASKSKPGLIIMSTHGRSGVTRWAFGSVADRIVRTSNIPVLTISPPGCRP